MPEGFEAKVIDRWAEDEIKTRSSIDAILGARIQHYESVFTTAILNIEMDGVILEPDEFNGLIEGEDGGNRMEGPIFQQRLRELLIALANKGIFSDDIVLVRGKLADNQMRELSYIIVEIPKLGGQILVNDQVGEATFVIDGIMSRNYLATVSKKQLQEEHEGKVKKVIRSNKDQWLMDIFAFLMGDVKDGKKLEKMDVNEQENVRKILIRRYTAKQWSEMTHSKKQNVEVNGKKLTAIATLFGIKGIPVGVHNDHLAVGRKLFGEEHECLWEFNQENVIKILTRRYTAKQWSEMKDTEKIKLKVCGIHRLISISNLFEIEGSPVSVHNVHLALGRKLFEEDNEHLQEFNQENVRKILIRRYTAKQWSEMTQPNKKEIIVSGKKLKAIATLFGIKGHPMGVHDFHLALGRKLFGEKYECLWEFNQENVRKILIRRYTAEQLSEMTEEDKNKIKVCGIKDLRDIGKLFGITRKFGGESSSINLGNTE